MYTAYAADEQDEEVPYYGNDCEHFLCWWHAAVGIIVFRVGDRGSAAAILFAVPWSLWAGR